MQKEITIIIPNYNGHEIIKKCLECLSDQSLKNFNVIVVDDYSIDNSVEIIEKYPVELIKNDRNMGFAYSVNQGIKAADTDYVLLLNNDVFIRDPKFLQTMLETIKADSRIFSVSSKMIYYNNPIIIDDAGDEYTLFGWVYKRGNGATIREYTRDALVFSACAGAGLYRRDVFNEIGYFDELHFAYLEDVDIGWRAQIEGYYNVYSAQSECYHLGSNTFAQGSKYSDQKVALSSRNNIYIIYKNMQPLQLILNLPFLLVGFVIKYFYFRHLGFGEKYLEGIKEGLLTLDKVKRFPYKKENASNYWRIQKEIFRSTITYINLKCRQVTRKIKDRLSRFGQKIKKRIPFTSEL